MRAAPGELPDNDSGWAFEIRWAGVRTLALCEPGHVTLHAAGEEITDRFPEIRAIALELAGRPLALDGSYRPGTRSREWLEVRGGPR